MRTLQGARAGTGGVPVHALLGMIPITCFIGALVTDVVYACTYNMQWTNMSAWLLAVGLLISIFVEMLGLIDFFASRATLFSRVSWIHGFGTGIALILAIFDSFVHSRDAYTSVVPTGLTLSAAVVVVLLGTEWLGWSLAPRFDVSTQNKSSL